MALSTNMISGLSSGFDWRTMIDQLMEVERGPINLIEDRKGEYEAKLSEWQSFNTKLLSLKTAAAALTTPADFSVYTAGMTSDSSTVQASDLLSVSTTSTAAPGTYTIKITDVAQAQKLSSSSFASMTTPLGSSYSGDILINGRVVNIAASDDLTSVRDKINNANTGTDPIGVSASIVNYGTNDYRLILTRDITGAEAIGLQNGSDADLVELFGWKDSSSSIKSSIAGGARSDSFTSSTQNIKTLITLSTTQSGNIQISGTDVAIDLSQDSLEDIKDKINTASITGVSASVTTRTVNGSTTYQLQIDGSQTFVDNQNILETLGVLHNGVSDVSATTSGNEMTADGSKITPSTLITSIDGYNTFTAGGSPGGDYITISGTDHSNNPVNTTFDITATSTVQDLLAAIETAFESGGDQVSVRVTSDGKVEVADLETGASSLSVNLSSTIQDSNSNLDWGSFSPLATTRKREVVSGQDATLSVDGVTVTSSDNSVDEVIPGVTLDLKKADLSTTVTLSIDPDVDAIVEKIDSFVDSYNAVTEYVNEQMYYDLENNSTGGVLFGDSTLTSVRSDLTSTLLQSVWGVATEFSTMGLVGINLDSEGTLSVDEATLRGYLETNFNDIRNLFVANGTSSTGNLAFVDHSQETQSGEYTVHITNAAVQSNTTSIDGGVAADETVTITEGDQTARIDLTSSMTLTQIVNGINTELDSVSTETLVGSESLTTDSGVNYITSSSNWSEIDGTTLADSDVITFTGATRDGTEISGEYEIQSVVSDTVQGLLAAIEVEYSNEVTASIDGNGRIVLADKYSGYSQLSLEISEPTGKGLDFGDVDVTPGAGDGSQEGRYTMSITASDDGSGHLTLTHDSYGSNSSFTVQESRNDGLWNQDTVITVDNGEDVEGTINGETADGSGQVLTGDAGEANVDGLVVRYTGTDEDVDVGSVKLTLGVAELFDRVLFNITDPLDGYASFKQESLQNSIDNFETQIEELEKRLDRKMETMVKRFVAMEKAINDMQTISSWLTTQLNSLQNNWG